MAFSKTAVLSTREVSFGSRRLGQVVAVPTGRLDKVSLYLEPESASEAAAEAAMVVVEVFSSDGFGLPTGSALAEDSVRLADIKLRGFYNFRLEADVPTVSVVTLRVEGGDAETLVGWRYSVTSSVGEALISSTDGGATWVQDSTRKFAYVAYSLVSDAVDADDQSATIQASTVQAVTDDDADDFSMDTVTLERAVVDGDTVVVDFGSMVVTLVVDQSGSMTWNDNDGVRFDFLNAYIDDLESILPAPATAKYSIVKFRSRKIGSMTLLAQSGEDVGAELQGVRIVRNVLGPPSTPLTLGNVVIFEGLAEQFVDSNLTPGTKYYYGAFAFDSNGNFSDPRIDFSTTESQPPFPAGVAGFNVVEQVVLSGFGDDIGTRNARITWSHPAGYSYTKLTLIRRNDRFADSPADLFPSDNVAVLLDEAALQTQYTDTGLATGQEYFYSIFTHGSVQKCLFPNARKKSLTTSLVERDWIGAEPPDDIPPVGFDDTAPAAPTGVSVTESPSELMIEWDAPGDDAVRWKIFHHETRFPRPMTPEQGAQDYDGEMVYDGASLRFIHRALDNGQPNFYVIVAIDASNNHSTGVEFTGTPSLTATDSIAPPPVSSFASESKDSTTNVLTWKLEGLQTSSVSAYFGDSVRLVANVSFADTEGAAVSSTFEIVEVSRTATLLPGLTGPEAEDIIKLSTMSSTTASLISAVVTTDPLPGFLNNVATASIKVVARLRVAKRATGELLHEVKTGELTINFSNPFDVVISNDPEQQVAVRAWSGQCSTDAVPEYDVSSVAGVYATSGESFNAALEVKYRGVPPADDITLRVRILDEETGLPSPTVKLPETRSDGAALITTSVETTEVVDRSGEPTGDSESRALVRVSVPPQDVPGNYILEVTASYRDFSRTTTLDVHFEPALNVDIEAKSFVPNGVDIAEQKAFVYFGAPDAPQNEKVPVSDLTVTDWSIRLIGGEASGKARPFFSRDGVPGTGVKAFTHGGVARNVFFGPGTDVETSLKESCTDGEMWEISATVKVAGQTATGYAAIELLTAETLDVYDRIFVRVADGGESVSGETSGLLAATEIYADGEMEATFEVIAKPEDDGDASDPRSGKFFRNSIVGLGGRVPSLEDGKIITAYLRGTQGDVHPSKMIIRTNLTGDDGSPRTAKAMVENGKALFHIRCNARISGEVPEPPLGAEIHNEVYSGDLLVFTATPSIAGLVVYTVVEVGGKPAVFSGGGFNLDKCTPTAFVSFREPLE